MSGSNGIPTTGFMGIFDAFRRGTPSTTTTTTVTTPNTADKNPTVPSSETKLSDGTHPAFPAVAKDGDKSPLAAFTDLWNIDPAKQTTIPTLSPNFNVDQNKIMESARTIDFTKGLSPELVEKATKGDGAALLQIINTASQNAFAQGALATTKIAEQGFKIHETNFRDKVMPDMFRKNAVSTAIAANPISQNPALAPMMTLLEAGLSAKYPTATPTEISQFAKTYLDGMAAEVVQSSGGTIITKSQADQQQQFTAKEPDWNSYFGVADTNNTGSS